MPCLHTWKHSECPHTPLNIRTHLSSTGAGSWEPCYPMQNLSSSLVSCSVYPLQWSGFHQRSYSKRAKQTFKWYCSQVLPRSEQVSNVLKARRVLTVTPPSRPWCDAGTWDRTREEEKNGLARQTQENKFSPDNIRWWSAWRTMEHDKDKCRLPPPESLIYQKH